MKKNSLEQIASELRGEIIANSSRTSTPHLGSCLSCVDILVALYFSVLKIDPDASSAVDRDRCVLSKGHAVPALFFTLAKRGFFPESDLQTYGLDGSIFHEHPPSPAMLNGIEAATGSLGHGLPISLGFAIYSKIKGINNHNFCILGDGECNEGTIWEAAMMAPAQKVNNLTVIVDYNKWQATGRSQEVFSLGNLADKWKAFGWQVSELDGHDISSLESKLNKCRDYKEQPSVIIANTVKGKGVSFMEDDNNWHYRIPNQDEVELAKIELGLSL